MFSFGYPMKKGGNEMETEKNADLKKEERSQIVDLGSDMTRS